MAVHHDEPLMKFELLFARIDFIVFYSYILYIIIYYCKQCIAEKECTNLFK